MYTHQNTERTITWAAYIIPNNVLMLHFFQQGNFSRCSGGHSHHIFLEVYSQAKHFHRYCLIVDRDLGLEIMTAGPSTNPLKYLIPKYSWKEHIQFNKTDQSKNWKHLQLKLITCLHLPVLRDSLYLDNAATLKEKDNRISVTA